MTPDDLRRWIDDYVRVWRTPGTDALVEVFTPDVRYLVSPWAEPIVGLDALAPFWESGRVGADERFTIRHEVVAVDGPVGVARVAVDYERNSWRDLWIVRLADDGRCAEFEEWPFRPGQDDGHA